MKNTNNRKRMIYFWWSASDVIGVEFLGYVKMRNGTGREDTNKIGVGVLAQSELFPPYNAKMTANKYKISPYTAIYRTYKSARLRKNAIKRPTVKEITEYENLTKKLKQLGKKFV